MVSAAFDALVGHADGRKERDRGGLDDARKEAMLQLARSLSLTGEHLHVMHDSIKRRIRSALHHGDDLQSIVSRSKRQLCSIVSCNMRGMRNKCTSLNGIDFWSYCALLGAQSICMQDTHFTDKQAVKLLAAAKCSMPEMENCSIAAQQSCSFTHKGNIRVGGVAALCGSTLAKYRTSEISDKRKWGRYTGYIIKGKEHSTVKQNPKARAHKGGARHLKLTNLAIINVYAAVESTSTNSMWKKQCAGIEKLSPGERQMRQVRGEVERPDPHKQLRHDLAALIADLKLKKSCNVIIVGDFNINLNKHSDRNTKEMIAWGEQHGLVNPYLQRFGHNTRTQIEGLKNPQNQHLKFDTWVASENTPDLEDREVSTGHLDHVWYSRDLLARSAVKGYSVAAHQLAGTDHRPVSIALDLQEILGINNNAFERIPLQKRVLMYKNEKQREKYSKLLDAAISKSDLRQMVNRVLKNPSVATKQELDDIMQLIVKLILEADKQVDTTPESKGNRKFRHAYSAELILRTRCLSDCKGLLKKCKSINKLEAERRYKLLAVKYSELLKLPQCPSHKDPYDSWNKWAGKASALIHELRHSPHHKHALEMREKSSEFAEKIEKHEESPLNPKCSTTI